MRFNNKNEQETSRQREQEDRGGERQGTWMIVGQHPWQQIMDSRKPVVKESCKAGRRLWVFGNSLMWGVGRWEIHCLSKGSYGVMDRGIPKASIVQVHRTVEYHLSELLLLEDLVVVEGGGNGLEETGQRSSRDDGEDTQHGQG